MTFDSVIQDIKTAKLAGRRYEKEGHGKFRDCVTVCRNGRFLFQRYCYGEAASLVCSMWAGEAAADGTIQWQYDTTDYSGKTEAPMQLTDVVDGKLVFDNKRLAFVPEADLKTVPGSGVSKLSVLFGG